MVYSKVVQGKVLDLLSEGQEWNRLMDLSVDPCFFMFQPLGILTSATVNFSLFL